MTNTLKIFKNLSWQDKIQFINKFYQAMINKTNNPEYVFKFQGKINEVNMYEENETNINKLISLYECIMGAKEKTKQRKFEETKKTIKENKQKLAGIEANEEEEDPDQYLSDAMAQI